MAYIGIQPAEKFTSFATQEFSTSATTSYTLDHAVANENEIALFVNNVRQQPGSGKAYTATGTALTLSAATASTDTMYCIFLGRALQTVTPATNSITAAMVGDDLISGKDALTSAPADTDEFLVSDAGTLKRIDYSLIKGGGITEYDMHRLTTEFQGTAVLTSNLERVDTSFEKIGTGMSESSGIFTFPSTGKYEVRFTVTAKNSQSSGERNYVGNIQLTTNNSSYSNVASSSNNIGYHSSSSNNWQTTSAFVFLDITDTTNMKVKFQVEANGNSNTYTIGNSASNNTYMTFIKIGDT